MERGTKGVQAQHMHYVRAGMGAPPFIFVHGFGCSHEDWSLQLDFFSKTNEVVGCDLRGHGQTPGRPHECSIEHFGADVAALLANLDLAPAVLIGHSMGCRVVLEAARRAPGRVARLVLIEGSRLATGDPETAETAARIAIDKSGYSAFADNLFRQMFFTPSALAETVLTRARRQPAEIGAALFPRLARWDAASIDAALAALRVPVLVIQSTRGDPKTLNRAPLKRGDSSPWLELLKGALENVEIEIVPAGHFTQLEAAPAVNQLIARFAGASR
jgi:pimeloyl-ACP methyl ester carboxylesterase